MRRAHSNAPPDFSAHPYPERGAWRVAVEKGPGGAEFEPAYDDHLEDAFDRVRAHPVSEPFDRVAVMSRDGEELKSFVLEPGDLPDASGEGRVPDARGEGAVNGGTDVPDDFDFTGGGR